jgi:hypothetical protein
MLLPSSIFPAIAALQIVAIQPMSRPVGQVFYLNYKYGHKSPFRFTVIKLKLQVDQLHPTAGG